MPTLALAFFKSNSFAATLKSPQMIIGFGLYDGCVLFKSPPSYISTLKLLKGAIYMVIRVVWQDSFAREKKPVKYRNHKISGYKDGWITDLPGDNNVYKTHYCALNAIDSALGDFGQKGSAKRKAYGVQVIGKKGGETA